MSQISVAHIRTYGSRVLIPSLTLLYHAEEVEALRCEDPSNKNFSAISNGLNVTELTDRYVHLKKWSSGK